MLGVMCEVLEKERKEGHAGGLFEGGLKREGYERECGKEEEKRTNRRKGEGAKLT